MAAKQRLCALSEPCRGSHAPARVCRASQPKTRSAVPQTLSEVAKSKQKQNEHLKGSKTDSKEFFHHSSLQSAKFFCSVGVGY